MYLRYVLFIPLFLGFNLFVWLTCWLWAAIVAVLKIERLPGILAWVHTSDDNIYGTRKTGVPMPSSSLERFKTAIWWLCRNPGFGFAEKVLGFSDDTVSHTVVTGDQNHQPEWAIIQQTANAGGRRYFFYRRRDWHGWRFNLGWTIGTNDTGWHRYRFDLGPVHSK